ncbi:transposase [Halomonas sp. KM007]
MGESISPWIPTCNGSIRVELDGQRTTSDSGVIEVLEDNLVDRLNPLRIRHSLASQLRTLVLQRAMGWIDLSDTDTLRRDPLWQLACSDARGMTPLAQDRPSQATLSRLLACLGRSDNTDAVHEGLLREGNAGPAEDADTWIPHLVRRLNESTGAQVRVRIDAGFTDNATLEALEERDIEYLGRLRSHTGLQKLAAPYLKRPSGRPPEQPREWCHDLAYQAGTWPTPRRVVLVVQERPDDLLLHAFFLVTNLGKFDWPPEKVLALYRKRGSAEAHMGEVKSALDVHLSSTDRGASTVQEVMARNEVSLLLSLYAYQVLHGLRCLLERQTHQGWSLSRMREQVLKIASTISLHARRITVHLGDAADKWWPTLLKGLPKLTALS